MSQLGRPASDVADTIDSLYTLVFWLAGGVFILIMALTLYFALAFREREGAEAMQFHGNARLEVLWTLIPVAIVAVIAIPTFNAIVDTHGDAPDGALEVIATGHQWWFEFEYPEFGITTANELYLPVDRPVSVTLLSVDVIHSFYVPRLAGKTDMVPGHENHLWFTPTEASDEPYLAQCYEFCGTAHANMRFRVFVREPGDFDAWVARMQEGDPAPMRELAQAGEQQFAASGCVGCHAITGNEAAVRGDVVIVCSTAVDGSAAFATSP
jgi:cytochrome c oxidase subunit 2